MSKLLLIYPHQLYDLHRIAQDYDQIWLLEEPLLFGADTRYPVALHKQKLVLHRAGLQALAAKLPADKVRYFQCRELEDGIGVWLSGDDKFDYFDVADDVLRRRLQRLPQFAQELESPNFYLPRIRLPDYIHPRGSRFTQFYIRRRRELGIWVKNGQPLGGKWSFDSQNRKKLPKDYPVPPPPTTKNNPYVMEAISYVEQHFPDRPGDARQFAYPVTRSEARMWLDDFIGQRLHDFGPFEDAIEPEHPVLFHSVLSSSLNCGLLHPQEVVATVEEAYKSGVVPLQSAEGFIRQVIGWREYMRAVYEVEGVSMRTRNHFEHERLLTSYWYDGQMKLPPFDDMAGKLYDRAYAHHIERLMVAGNLMLLCRIHPDEVYRWFMELFIDAYDWVMVPNVYGMSQFADGGTIVTKPYISGANYIDKMSSYSKRKGWAKTWDSLFWSFIGDNYDTLQQHYRLRMVLKHWQQLSATQQREHHYQAARFREAVTR